MSMLLVHPTQKPEPTGKRYSLMNEGDLFSILNFITQLVDIVDDTVLSDISDMSDLETGSTVVRDECADTTVEPDDEEQSKFTSIKPTYKVEYSEETKQM